MFQRDSVATPAAALLARGPGTPRTGGGAETDDESAMHETQAEPDVLSIHTAQTDGEESVAAESEATQVLLESTMSFTAESKAETIPEVELEVDEPTPSPPVRRTVTKSRDDDSDDVSDVTWC